MTIEQAKALVLYESREGIAYTSRYGQYPDRTRLEEILTALRVIHQHLHGQKNIARDLAASLFTINDQLQGNMGGAKAKDIPISDGFNDSSFIEINNLLYAIFEDGEDMPPDSNS